MMAENEALSFICLSRMEFTVLRDRCPKVFGILMRSCRAVILGFFFQALLMAPTSLLPYVYFFPEPGFLAGTSPGRIPSALFSSVLMVRTDTPRRVATSFCFIPASLRARARTFWFSLSCTIAL